MTTYTNMTVRRLIKLLKKENPSLDVRLFAHDHNPEAHDEGVGFAFSVYETTNDADETFVGIQA